MTTMCATCLVTIQPNITPAGTDRLVAAIIDRLWPGNAGGVHLMYQWRGVTPALKALCAEVVKRGHPLEVRVRRNGFTLTVEPADQRDLS